MLSMMAESTAGHNNLSTRCSEPVNKMFQSCSPGISPDDRKGVIRSDVHHINVTMFVRCLKPKIKSVYYMQKAS